MDAGPILGLSALRTAFLVDLPSAEPREGQAGIGAWRVTHRHDAPPRFTTPFHLFDEIDDDGDDRSGDDDEESDDEDEESDEDDDEDDEEDDEEETETWQVSAAKSFVSPA